ncbi:hypothetical protein DL96DRAFT_1613303 [Flagelloscypha sp. PMI_526]|nr:hypothetical protein DL96DRAFT_1613303 [Flagelloscypha sp. PMI_526]
MMSVTSLPELPAELQGKILQQAAQGLSVAESTFLMLVSRMAYDRVTYIAYKIISIITFNRFQAFLLLVETKGVAFIASRLRGLHVRVFLGADASALWKTLFTSVIPNLINLRYFEAWGNLGAGPQATSVQQALLFTLPTLANLTYFGANTSIFVDSSSANFPIFQSVTHLKRFNHTTPVESTLHMLKSFPNVTHFLTPISGDGFSGRVTALVERLSYLKVIILACYGSTQNDNPKPLLARFPNLVFRDIDEIFNHSDVPRFREIAGEGMNDVWSLAEKAIIQRRL